jgi:hypothetical protein
MSKGETWRLVDTKRKMTTALHCNTKRRTCDIRLRVVAIVGIVFCFPIS